MDLEESKDLVRETLRLLPGRPMPVGEIPSIPFLRTWPCGTVRDIAW